MGPHHASFQEVFFFAEGRGWLSSIGLDGSKLASGQRYAVACVVLPAAKVAFLLSIFDSTGEIESSFSILKHFATLAPENKDAYMKVYSDCPSIDDVVRYQDGVYEPTAFCHRIFEEFRARGPGKNLKTSNLPRRQYRSRKKSTGWAAFDRRRRSEQLQLAQPDADEEGDVGHLAAACAREAGKRQSQGHMDLVTGMKQKAAERMLQFRLGPTHNIAKKLKEHEDAALSCKATLERMEARSLETQLRKFPAGRTTIVIVGDCSHEKARVRKLLGRVPVIEFGRIYGPSGFLNEVSEETFLERVADAPNLVWLCVDADSWQKMLRPETHARLPDSPDLEQQDEKVLKEVSLAFASRILGGFLATSKWLDVVCGQSEPVAPILELVPGYTHPHQFYISKQVPEKLSNMFRHLHSSLLVHHPDRLRWIPREKKMFPLTLACK